MTPLKVAIIGDHFMQPAFFVDALRASLPQAQLDIRTLELDWPDTPTVHGYGPQAADPELAGLKEYLGDPREMAAFINNAQVLINHLAPVTGAMLAACAHLQLLALARGGPVNVDRSACSSWSATPCSNWRTSACALPWPASSATFAMVCAR